jgi:uncharacterized membrane protein
MSQMPAPPDTRVTLTRVEALSDGAFSIALTLLVLEIHIPKLGPDAPTSALIEGLLNQWPYYISYALTFMTIGSVWITHHQMLKFIDRVDYRFQVLNLLMLMFITLTPFTTGLLAEYLLQPEKLRIAAFVYGMAWLCQGLTIALLWFYSIRHGLLKAGIPRLVLRRATRGYISGTIFGTIGAVLALINPAISLTIYLLIAFVYLAIPRLVFGESV